MKILKQGLLVLSALYLAMLCVLWASPYWPTGLYWLAILFQMIPLWTLYFPAIILLLITVAARSWRIALINIISVLIVLFCIMGYKIAFPEQKIGDMKPGRSLRVITCNLGGVTDAKYLLNLIRRTDADIVAMQEVNSEIQNSITEALALNKWELSFDGHLGLASRLKILNVETKDRRIMGGWGMMAASYELEGPSGRMNLVNVHLDTPRTGIEAIIDDGLGGLPELKRVSEVMLAESVMISRWASTYNNVLVMGDFNMANTSPIYRECWSSYTDVFSRVGHGFGYTKYTSWHGVRIDHILSDDNWRAIHSEAGADVGSDHRPLIADLEFVGGKV